MPGWFRGLIFSVFFIFLIFFLKIICPLSVGCLSDPFFVPIFYPLVLIKFIFGVSSAEVLGRWEPIFILFFWALVGIILGYIYDIYKNKRNRKIENFNL
ncbi:MAG: hypothetical protein CO184_01425 [Candidatus Zambryskibacteria bacterium CG_4_9_14_3_um_filter_40_16]|uniref:Uncharacterized protein n=2 Tax=Candidatus Zambryskiibacteriota TaxID=1817925 RepID=A0A2H0K7E3_9BACT|nr:MAG: hypothetical protein COV95_00180 [Candidatus Zambryskibacteria bacterium CG11_big_fil_rev_8_21_14_0_20_40_24]PJA33621.1 MAG: hypothetical protein CO184_01425 [Candidatus Zambryskibacteria bacterium CG_4_9_14_3_um_filter_40_16]